MIERAAVGRRLSHEVRNSEKFKGVKYACRGALVICHGRVRGNHTEKNLGLPMKI